MNETFLFADIAMFLLVVEAGQAEWREMHCDFVVEIELTRLHGSDDITCGHGRRYV